MNGSSKTISWHCTVCPHRHRVRGIKVSIYVMLGCGIVDENDWAVFVGGDATVGLLCANGACCEHYHYDIRTNTEHGERLSCRSSQSRYNPQCVGHPHHRNLRPCDFSNPVLIDANSKMRHYAASYRKIKDTLYKCPYHDDPEPQQKCEFEITPLQYQTKNSNLVYL
jgi:hypothetical protein